MQQCEVVQVCLTKQGMNETVVIEALTFPTICTPLPPVAKIDCCVHLKELELADSSIENSDEIDLLMGSDYYWSIVTGEILNGGSGPTAISSKLGWLLSGPAQTTSHSMAMLVNLSISECVPLTVVTSETDTLMQLLKSFWQLETLGIVKESHEEEYQERFLNKMQFTGTRYKVGLPWSRDLQDVPCHFHMCLSRLKALQYRLLRDVDVLKVYDETIKDQLERGIVETVEVDHKGINQVHYLPHLPVVRSDRSTTKVRVVYDSSAKSSESNLSLNDCLQKGPNLIPKIFKVLVRFRSYPIAVTANIEKAFLMIEIEESDRDMLRFLWFSDPFDVKGEIQHLRFTRLVFGLKLSPAILRNVIGLHCLNFKTEYPDLVQLVDHSLYVDDLISGADTSKCLSIVPVSQESDVSRRIQLKKMEVKLLPVEETN